MKDKTKLFKNIVLLGVVQCGNYLIPFLTIPIITRIIGPEKLGILDFSTSLVSYFGFLISYSFDLTATREVAMNPDYTNEERSVLFNNVLFAKVLLFIISIFIFTILLISLPGFKENCRVPFFTFLICISWVLMPNWLYQGMQDLSKVAIFNFISKLLYCLVVVAFIRTRENYYLQPLFLSIISILVTSISFYIAVRKYKISIRMPALKSVITFIKRDRTIFLSRISSSVYTTSIVLILGLMVATESIAYYTSAWKVISMFQMLLLFPFSQAYFPYIGKKMKEDRQAGIAQLKKIIPIIFWITLVGCLFLFIFSKAIVSILYGQQFFSAVITLRVLSMAPLFIIINNVLGTQVMLSLKYDNAFFKITSVITIASIILSGLLIYYFSYVGAAFSWLATEIMLTICFNRFLMGKSLALLGRNILNISTTNEVNPIAKLKWRTER